ncbi:hypothetical protein KIN20_034142 [Parelaphostrongylus tenuis]|uniref:Major facilitator superfamily (MFS) profile domain-containing protein n=1 Tax=Parelaphostrongylus tenuis TaxID=148309 RepID=A0AAD5WJG1_PARTN|nr:hypothetical protein KIN20_034142 [Parelaphostrongylus tenuis]
MPRSISRHRKTPQTPKTPISPRLSGLPAIEESRESFSFAIQPPIDSQTQSDESSTSIDNVPLQTPQTDWKSIRLMAVIVLLTRIQFTVYFASLWPFLQELDGSATMNDYALITAMYSIGIAGSAPLFGYWSNKLGCIRIPSICSMVLMLMTNLLYIIMHNFTGYAKYMMGMARFLSGIAAGGNNLLPIYWTYAATVEDRSTAAALFDGAFCLGIALGPGFQLIFSLLNYPGIVFGFTRINMYTMPAMVASVLIGTTLILMTFFFNEVPMFCKAKRKVSIAQILVSPSQCHHLIN